MIFLTTSYIMVTPVSVQSHLRSDTSDGSTRVPPAVWRPTSHFRLLSNPSCPWSAHYLHKCTEQQIIPWSSNLNCSLFPPEINTYVAKCQEFSWLKRELLFICLFMSPCWGNLEKLMNLLSHSFKPQCQLWLFSDWLRIKVRSLSRLYLTWHC